MSDNVTCITAKVVITETGQRDSKWPAAFAQQISKGTSKKWVSEGWDETDGGYWNLILSNSEFRLTLKFSDGSYGYILTSYTLNMLGTNLSDTVVRVFNNNKELFGLVSESVAKLQKRSEKIAPNGKSEFFLAVGLIFEDGYYELPKDLKVLFPADKFDKNNKEPQYLIAYKKFEAASIEAAREELIYVKKAILSYWQEGYYPPAYSLVNLSTSKMVTTNIASESHGYLGSFDGKRYTINDALKLAKMKVKITGGVAAELQAWADTVASYREIALTAGLTPIEAKVQRRMLAEATLTSGFDLQAAATCTGEGRDGRLVTINVAEVAEKVKEQLEEDGVQDRTTLRKKLWSYIDTANAFLKPRPDRSNAIRREDINEAVYNYFLKFFAKQNALWASLCEEDEPAEASLNDCMRNGNLPVIDDMDRFHAAVGFGES